MTTGLAPDEQKVVDAVRKELFVGGSWRPATEGGSLDVHDPSTGDTLCAIADATPGGRRCCARRRC